jgi:hypothetical protein
MTALELLQRDIEQHATNLEYSILLFPLLRVAIAIRAGEIVGAIRA